jgi:large subunit ribosomal protein L2
MGRPIIAQKRGKGGSVYRVPNYKFQPKLTYKNAQGKVTDIVNDKRRNPPLAEVTYQDSTKGYMVAPEGIKVGDTTSEIVRPLAEIPVGTQIFSIETVPNSGPKLCRTAGSAAVLVSKSEKTCIIQLPSKKTKILNMNCRATMGRPAGDGRRERPWMKAGKKWHAMHSRGKMYPRSSANKMNATDHPFGGHARLGRPKSCARGTPPGRKVGSIASKRTGKRKK